MVTVQVAVGAVKDQTHAYNREWNASLVTAKTEWVDKGAVDIVGLPEQQKDPGGPIFATIP